MSDRRPLHDIGELSVRADNMELATSTGARRGCSVFPACLLAKINRTKILVSTLSIYLTDQLYRHFFSQNIVEIAHEYPRNCHKRQAMDPAENAANRAGELTTTRAGECENHDCNTGDDRLTSTSDASRAEKGEVTSSPKRASCKTSKYSRGWRRIVRNFTPSWFAVNMGTGIVSILLHNLPYNGQWLQYISYIFFALNAALFVLFLFLSLLRYTLYPKIWTAMIRHPAQSLFLGCFPMGLATIINMVCFVCVPKWGGEWWRVAWALWWIDTAIASATCVYLPFVM